MMRVRVVNFINGDEYKGSSLHSRVIFYSQGFLLFHQHTSFSL